jgi:hypothetical protein
MMSILKTLREYGLTRTNAVALLIFLTGLAEYLSTDPFINNIPDAPSKILMVNAVLMFILRAVTRTPVFGKEQK